MGGMLGGRLAQGGVEVTLLDVAQPAVDAINAHGLRIEDKAGNVETVRVPATTNPADVAPVDLAILFVKCYHTEAAVRNALPLLRSDTPVLTLQNGWGNAPRIAAILGHGRVLAGVTYHSASLLGPGHILHAGRGMSFIGELDGSMSQRLAGVVEAFQHSGLDVTPTDNVLTQIWRKLALNVATLPTSALLRLHAHELIEHEGRLALMRALLHEVIAVAQAQQIDLEFDERWDAITGLLKKAVGAKASMLQDVEARRRTEIDVINGAIVEAGERLGIPTPYNNTMVWMVKSLEATL
jgi:2-dehydropantoate 2-reductase